MTYLNTKLDCYSDFRSDTIHVLIAQLKGIVSNLDQYQPSFFSIIYKKIRWVILPLIGT